MRSDGEPDEAAAGDAPRVDPESDAEEGDGQSTGHGVEGDGERRWFPGCLEGMSVRCMCCLTAYDWSVTVAAVCAGSAGQQQRQDPLVRSVAVPGKVQVGDTHPR